MNLDLLFGAPVAVQMHSLGGACRLGDRHAKLVRTKGTTSHKLFGWTWVMLIVLVAVGSFWIRRIDMWHGFSAIHLLSIYTLLMVPPGIWRIRRGDIGGHRSAMVGTSVGGLVTAGLLTLMPGRLEGRAAVGWE